MKAIMPAVKRAWLLMLEPPWKHSGAAEQTGPHWLYWFVGWAWALAGVVLGALVAPSVVQWAGLFHSRYQDWLVILAAVLGGFLVQFLGWMLLIPVLLALYAASAKWPGQVFAARLLAVRTPSGRMFTVTVSGVFGLISNAGILICCLLPLAGVGYGIYRYLTWVGSGQRSVTIAFVGALLIKSFAIPLIKGLVTGALFTWFMRWLRGDEAKTKGA